MPDERAEERRAARDQAHHAEEPPARTVGLGAERADDAEPLGRVVQPEADDEQQRQLDLVVRSRLPDCEPLGEVVQADPDCDQQREALRLRQVMNA